MTDESITCRAKVSSTCSDGKSIFAVYDDADDFRSDSTYDGKSVVCTSCYLLVEPFMRMNMFNIPFEVDTATRHYNVNRNYVREQDDAKLHELLAEAVGNRDRTRPGSPMHVSSKACVKMVVEEMNLRGVAVPE